MDSCWVSTGSPTKKGKKESPGGKAEVLGNQSFICIMVRPPLYVYFSDINFSNTGLLMNSEVWVCLTAEERALPFVLAENGYDVWVRLLRLVSYSSHYISLHWAQLGNNRGNKYSKKHTTHNPSSIAFWDFSIDDFCLYDIPDSIQYVLDTTRARALSYIGFSQGTAQAFAALGVHPYLNERVNLFVALAPAMRPRGSVLVVLNLPLTPWYGCLGLAAPIVDALMKASPTLVFLFFGRKSILSSTAMWQSILCTNDSFRQFLPY